MRLALLVAVALLVIASLGGLAEHRGRTAEKARADSALADYHRLAVDSLLTAGRERQADADAQALIQHAAGLERAATDSLATIRRLLAVLDVQADSTLAVAETTGDSLIAYRDAYQAQRAATGRLLATAALVTDSLLRDKNAIIANRETELREARLDRDRWKASADQLAASVEELKGGGKILGFIPKPPKWVAALVGGTVGCITGALVSRDRKGDGCAKGGGVGAATLVTVIPTD